MKINPMHPVNPYQNSLGVTGKKAAEASQKRDEVQISSEAKQMQQSSQVSLDRQEKVQQIKEKVDNGTYKVNPQEVAKNFYEFWSE